jgi:hypothetical protein
MAKKTNWKKMNWDTLTDAWYVDTIWSDAMNALKGFGE